MIYIHGSVMTALYVVVVISCDDRGRSGKGVGSRESSDSLAAGISAQQLTSLHGSLAAGFSGASTVQLCRSVGVFHSTRLQ